MKVFHVFPLFESWIVRTWSRLHGSGHVSNLRLPRLRPRCRLTVRPLWPFASSSFASAYETAVWCSPTGAWCWSGVSLAPRYQPLPAALRPALRPLQLSCEVRYRASGMAAAEPGLSFRTARSDRETEGAKEYQHLRGDAVYSAVDDANDGDHEATRNIGHGNLLFLGRRREFVAALLGIVEFRRGDRGSGGARATGGRCRRRCR